MARRGFRRDVLPAVLLLASVAAASPFGDPTSHEVGEFPVGVTIGDADGDGLADVAVANALSGDVSLLVNDGTGLGPEQRIDHGPGDARQVAIEDVDGDGDRDLVVLIRNGESLVAVLRNQGDGSYAPPEPHGAPGFAFALRMADVDRDGDPDVLAVSGFVDEAVVTLLSNDGTGSFEFAGSFPVAAAPFIYVADIDVADVDGDVAALPGCEGFFVTAEDVGEFVEDRQFSDDANVLHDADAPGTGSGFWYLVRPDCA